MRLRILECADSTKVKGIAYVRDILTGKIPPWQTWVWLASRFRVPPGEIKPQTNENILEALAYFSSHLLSKFAKFNNTQQKKHKEFLTIIRNNELWAKIPSIISDLCHSYQVYCQRFETALITTLGRLPRHWSILLPQQCSFKVSLHSPDSLDILVDAAFFSAWQFSPMMYLKDLKSLFIPFWTEADRLALPAVAQWQRLNLLYYLPEALEHYREENSREDFDFFDRRVIRISEESSRIRRSLNLVRDLNVVIKRFHKNFKLGQLPDRYSVWERVFFPPRFGGSSTGKVNNFWVQGRFKIPPPLRAQ